eukprot:gene3794-4191_t
MGEAQTLLLQAILTLARNSGANLPAVLSPPQSSVIPGASLSPSLALSSLLSPSSLYDAWGVTLGPNPYARLPGTVDTISNLRASGLYEVSYDTTGVNGVAADEIPLALNPAITALFTGLTGVSDKTRQCVSLDRAASQFTADLDSVSVGNGICSTPPDAPGSTVPYVAVAVDRDIIATVTVNPDTSLAQNPDISAGVTITNNGNPVDPGGYTYVWGITRDGVPLTPREIASQVIGGAPSGTSTSEVALDISTALPGVYEFTATATNKQDPNDQLVASKTLIVSPPPNLASQNALAQSGKPTPVSGADTISLTTVNSDFSTVCGLGDPGCPIEYMFYMQASSSGGNVEAIPLLDTFQLLPSTLDGTRPTLDILAPILGLPSSTGTSAVAFGVMVRDPTSGRVRTLTSLDGSATSITQTIRDPLTMATGQALDDIQRSLASLRGSTGAANAASGSLAALLLSGLSGEDPARPGITSAERTSRSNEDSLATTVLLPEVVQGLAQTRLGTACVQ